MVGSACLMAEEYTIPAKKSQSNSLEEYGLDAREACAELDEVFALLDQKRAAAALKSGSSPPVPEALCPPDLVARRPDRRETERAG
jgi:hypothetical protein